MSSEPTTTWADRDAVDRAAIIDTVNQLYQSIDRREWETFRSCFAEGELAMDFTATFGGEPISSTADEQVEQSRRRIEGFDATQHMISTHVVAIDGDEAICETSNRTTLFLSNDRGGDRWMVAGCYDFDLVREDDGWHIAGVTTTEHWTEGNRELFELAVDRFEEKE